MFVRIRNRLNELHLHSKTCIYPGGILGTLDGRERAGVKCIVYISGAFSETGICFYGPEVTWKLSKVYYCINIIT